MRYYISHFNDPDNQYNRHIFLEIFAHIDVGRVHVVVGVVVDNVVSLHVLHRRCVLNDQVVVQSVRIIIPKLESLTQDNF